MAALIVKYTLGNPETVTVNGDTARFISIGPYVWVAYFPGLVVIDESEGRLKLVYPDFTLAYKSKKRADSTPYFTGDCDDFKSPMHL